MSWGKERNVIHFVHNVMSALYVISIPYVYHVSILAYDHLSKWKIINASPLMCWLALHNGTTYEC